MIARRGDHLSYRLIAAGALLLLAFLPLVLSKNGNTAHPVSGYRKMTMHTPVAPGR